MSSSKRRKVLSFEDAQAISRENSQLRQQFALQCSQLADAVAKISTLPTSRQQAIRNRLLCSYAHNAYVYSRHRLTLYFTPMPLVEKNDRVVRRSAKGQYTNVSNFRIHLTHYVKGGESSAMGRTWGELRHRDSSVV